MDLGLSVQHRAIISAIFSKYPDVKKVLVYGSRAKGTFRPGSDIDMTITDRSDLPTDILFKLINDFESSPLPFSVDLSVFSSLTNPDLIAHIQRVGKVIYARSGNNEPINTAEHVII